MSAVKNTCNNPTWSNVILNQTQLFPHHTMHIEHSSMPGNCPELHTCTLKYSIWSVLEYEAFNMERSIWSIPCHMECSYMKHSIWSVPYGVFLYGAFHMEHSMSYGAFNMERSIWSVPIWSVPYRAFHVIWSVPYGYGVFHMECSIWSIPIWSVPIWSFPYEAFLHGVFL